MPTPAPADLVVPDASGLRAWLLAHHETSTGVWLALSRKGGTTTSLTWAEAVDEGLCSGWIDGQARRRDEHTSSVRFTPRGPRSTWSRRNVDNVTRLEAAGLMTPRCLAAVEAARADGRRERAYAGPATMQVPDDLLTAIRADPRALAMWQVTTRTNRYAMAHRLGQLERAETRERRIRELVEMPMRHETPHPQRARPAVDRRCARRAATTGAADRAAGVRRRGGCPRRRRSTCR